MNMLSLYNTATRKIEEFRPIDPENVRMYSCGPTVYDYQHIGHMRTYVGDDILIRVLKEQGYKVKQVMNITDVGHLTSDGDTGEDKMEKGAKKAGMSVWEIAKMFERQFFDSLDKLNVQRPDVVMRATHYIKDQIELIEILEEKGFTYQIADGIYFDTSKFKGYSTLLGNKKEDLKAGARVEMVPGKKNPTDFALWKFDPEISKNGEVKRQMDWWFRGPFKGELYKQEQWEKLNELVKQGKVSEKEANEAQKTIGFPGWHIECSAMSMRALGPTFDIHTGGIDHITVHHPNEIAQSESASSVKFVNFWVHPAFLLVEGEKMSKSLENTYTVDDVMSKGFNPLSLRYLFLQTHYRQEMNFTWESLAGAQNALYRIYETASELSELGEVSPEYANKFYEAISNDLDMPKALSIIWELLRSKTPNPVKAATLYKMDEVFGLKIKENSKKLKNVPEEVLKMAKERDDLRRAKRYHLADQMRAKIEKMGFVVEDTKKGSRVTRRI